MSEVITEGTASVLVAEVGVASPFSHIDVDTNDADGLGIILADMGVSDACNDTAVRALRNRTFLSPIKITDASKELAHYIPMLTGTISVKTSDTQIRPAKSFAFNPDSAQKVFIVSGVVQTKLAEPDEFGCLYGPRAGFFILFPEVVHESDKAGLSAEEVAELRDGEYDPIFRLIVERFTDLPKPTINAFLLGASIDGFPSNFLSQFPQMAYRAARVLGIPDTDLDVRPTLYKDREQAQAKTALARLQNGGSQNGRFTTLPGAPTGGNASPGFRVTESVELP